MLNIEIKMRDFGENEMIWKNKLAMIIENAVREHNINAQLRKVNQIVVQSKYDRASKLVPAL